MNKLLSSQCFEVSLVRPLFSFARFVDLTKFHQIWLNIRNRMKTDFSFRRILFTFLASFLLFDLEKYDFVPGDGWFDLFHGKYNSC